MIHEGGTAPVRQDDEGFRGEYKKRVGKVTELPFLFEGKG